MKVGERFMDCIKSTASSDHRSVMVWGAISASGKESACESKEQSYCADNCLLQHPITLINQHNNNMTFQHDNARPHAANITLHNSI